MSSSGILTDGYPSMEEIRAANGWPAEDRFEKGPVAILECVQEIPCNPCEDACLFGAIHVGSPITNCPTLSEDQCTGCGVCVAQCPGLAIFIVDKTYGPVEATVSFPYEYLPLPKPGDTVQAVNRACEFVCEATVIKVLNIKKQDHTPVVTIAVPKEYADSVRSIRRLGAPMVRVSPEAAQPGSLLPDDVLICRCEEITAEEIRRAIREQGASSVTEVKRRTRAGMGLCQGKSCGKIITRMIAEELGRGPAEILPAADRPPVRPVTFSEIGGKQNG